ncbi:MAG: nucleoside triphosphate pyrophosphohydrolase [Bacteroidetes bacterium HGW-Bacteroidetes-5]|jgi:XTP/dITP diphosphohydrolase|nr:MAG: nucleoside triphosphate pyrophosphohydrolase [Bacteroidetes bacterium HGW-Bacteroidetes-5]
MEREKAVKSFERLLDIMDELRAKCPWDKEQTMESLRPLTIEETYELSDAILEKESTNIGKELGDILLHIVFYAKIGREQGVFDISTIIDGLCNKLVYRHPHVFSQTEVNGTREVIENWEQLKGKEVNGNRSLLSGVPGSLPSLVKAYRIQDKARAVGFDWDIREQVWDKVREEIAEFEREIVEEEREFLSTNAEGGDGRRAEQEFGDLLFSLVNAARLYNINPDTALEMTNKKFIKRFNYLEEKTIKAGRSLKDMSLQAMDLIWEEAKKL